MQWKLKFNLVFSFVNNGFKACQDSLWHSHTLKMVIWQSRWNRPGKKCPRVPFWGRGGGGCNRYLGNAQIEGALTSLGLPLAIAAHCWPLLSIIIHCCPLLSIDRLPPDGTFWILLRMCWMNYSCVLRQFLGKINHCWRFPMFSIQSTTVSQCTAKVFSVNKNDYCTNFALSQLLNVFATLVYTYYTGFPAPELLKCDWLDGNLCRLLLFEQVALRC